MDLVIIWRGSSPFPLIFGVLAAKFLTALFGLISISPLKWRILPLKLVVLTLVRWMRLALRRMQLSRHVKHQAKPSW
jgi:hypothetical protein